MTCWGAVYRAGWALSPGCSASYSSGSLYRRRIRIKGSLPNTNRFRCLMLYYYVDTTSNVHLRPCIVVIHFPLAVTVFVLYDSNHFDLQRADTSVLKDTSVPVCTVHVQQVVRWITRRRPLSATTTLAPATSHGVYKMPAPQEHLLELACFPRIPTSEDTASDCAFVSGPVYMCQQFADMSTQRWTWRQCL